MNRTKVKNLIDTARLKRTVKETDPLLWIFSSTDNCNFNYNSKYLFLHVRKEHPEIRPRFVMNDDRKRKELSKRYGEEYFIDTRTREGIQTALKGGVWFTSAGLPLYGKGLSKGRRIVNLWHGVPLKRIALDDPTLGKLGRMYFKSIFSENYTDVLTTSKNLVPIMAKALGVKEEIIRIWGQPRNDGLAEVRKEDKPSISDGFRILYAPTFRSNQPIRLFPFADYDQKALEDFLAKHQMEICLRTHLYEGEKQTDYESEHVRFYNEDQVEDIMETLAEFDLLITDYSSIFIDYLLLERPIIFLPYDRKEYESGHGFYFDYDWICSCGKVAESQEDFLGLLEQAAREKGESTPASGLLELNDFFNEVKTPSCEDICRHLLDSDF